jgi:hypothetical protein
MLTDVEHTVLLEIRAALLKILKLLEEANGSGG